MHCNIKFLFNERKKKKIMSKLNLSLPFCAAILLQICILTTNAAEGKIANRDSQPAMDSMFQATFSISDLMDNFDAMMPGFNSSDLDALAEEDTPGLPLDPYDFLDAADPELELLKTPISDDNVDPITAGDGFEGDIKNVDFRELKAIYDIAAQDNRRDGLMRNAIKDEWRKWPGGVVPYIISSQYNRYERSIIAKAMQEYKDKTCIR